MGKGGEAALRAWGGSGGGTLGGANRTFVMPGWPGGGALGGNDVISVWVDWEGRVGGSERGVSGGSVRVVWTEASWTRGWVVEGAGEDGWTEGVGEGGPLGRSQAEGGRAGEGGEEAG